MAEANTDKNAKKSDGDLGKISRQLGALTSVVDRLQTDLAMKETILQAQSEELERIRAEASTDAKNRPAIKSDRVESSSIEIVEELTRALRSFGESKDALDERELPIIDKAPSQEKLAELAFMEEKIKIMVHDTTDPYAIPVPPVWNDGMAQYFIRGEEQVVKRKYVERLARAKITTFTQHEIIDEQGNRDFFQKPHTTLMFPFDLIEDANPKGRAWLRSVIQDPQ